MQELRPREKLTKVGVYSLSISELLAILLGSGNKHASVYKIAEKVESLLHDRLWRINEISLKDLTQIKGIGKVGALRIIAGIELGRRLFSAKVQIRDIRDILLLSHKIRNKSKETLLAIYLSGSLEVLKEQILSVGSQNTTMLDAIDIFGPALRIGASCFVLVHNHPSGNISPSEADITFTQRVQKIGELLGIPLLDHVIVSKDDHISLVKKQ